MFFVLFARVRSATLIFPKQEVTVAVPALRAKEIRKRD